MTDFTLSDGRRVHLIGDPHLGKNFDQNAPIHRRGERAVKQMAQFVEELNVDADVVVMVGDLFDTPYVPQGVIVSAARAVLAAAENNDATAYIMMAGNHDVSRNLSAVGAWHSFTKMLEGRLPNLHVIREATFLYGIALFPWEWDRTAEQQVDELPENHWPILAAVGHWDLKAFGEDESHLVPVRKLRTKFGGIPLFSGHFHTPGLYGEVTCTGSMQPYSHGEDPDGQLYVTLPLADALADPDALRDKHVRLIVKPGEEIPELDCLALTHQRVRDDEEISAVTLSLDNFDWNARLRERIAKLPETVRNFIVERIPDAGAEEQRGSSAGDCGEGPTDGSASQDGVLEEPAV